MSNEYVPIVGDWYTDEAGDSFEVIFVDEAADTVEVQHYDGSVSSMDFESWSEQDLTPRAPAEDCRGTFDDLEAADLDETAAAMRPHEWGNPLDTLDALERDD